MVTARVIYKRQLMPDMPDRIKRAIHSLEVDYKNTAGTRTITFKAEWSTLERRAWGLDKEHIGENDPAAEDMISLHDYYSPQNKHKEENAHSNTALILDAFIHCIDKTSGREAVYEAEAEKEVFGEIWEHRAFWRSPASLLIVRNSNEQEEKLAVWNTAINKLEVHD